MMIVSYSHTKLFAYGGIIVPQPALSMELIKDVLWENKVDSAIKHDQDLLHCRVILHIRRTVSTVCVGAVHVHTYSTYTVCPCVHDKHNLHPPA